VVDDGWTGFLAGRGGRLASRLPRDPGTGRPFAPANPHEIMSLNPAPHRREAEGRLEIVLAGSHAALNIRMS
jgi:hypothetical protein